MRLYFNFLIILFSLFITSCAVDEECGYDTNCEDYISQAAAQLAYDLDPNCRGDLDADNDGKACEEWESYYQNQGGASSGSSSTGCPTTAACGCSGHNMAECNADPCCKWTVGQGCGCL